MDFVTITNTFSNGNTIDAGEVNTNFDDAIAGINAIVTSLNVAFDRVDTTQELTSPAANTFADLSAVGPSVSVVVPTGETWTCLVAYGALLRADDDIAAFTSAYMALNGAGATTITPSVGTGFAGKFLGWAGIAEFHHIPGAAIETHDFAAGTTTLKAQYATSLGAGASNLLFSNRWLAVIPSARSQ